MAQNLGANWVGAPTISVAGTPSSNPEGNWGSSAPYSLGQSFTAPVSGTLSSIQMYVTGKNTTNVLYLYDMGVSMRYAAAQPSAITPGSNGVGGNLLSSNLSIVIANQSNPSVMQLTFSGADAVPIIGGHEYLLNVGSLTSGSQTYWHRSSGASDLYAGGAGYRQNSLINGSSSIDFYLAISLVNTSAAPVVYNCVVDWTNLHQRIDGFGASSAWRSTWTPTLADMFFSTNSGTGVTLDGKTNYPFVGIGLSMLRSRIVPGGTTWENSIMQYAQARGARVWSAPWSPDGRYKTATNWNGGSFVSANNQAYATQLAGYVVNMQSQYGVNIYALSVQNEPSVSAAYESCTWTAQQIHDFVPYLRSALVAANRGGTRIIAAEDEHWQTNYYGAALSDAAVATNVDIVACHNYDNSPPSGVPAALPRFANPNAALWETETSKLAGNGAFDPSISDGMYWAGRIHLFMSTAQVNAWHYWWLISNNADNEGLTDNNALPAKRMYVLGQYSRFVRPDWYRIDEGNNNPYAVLVTAYKDPVSGGFAIVVANTNASATNQSFNLANFTATTVTPWITSSSQSLAVQSPVPVTNAVFSYAIPAMSVVTFVGNALTNGTIVPVLAPVPDQTINPGATLLVTNVVADANVPPLVLTFTLPNGPTNAMLTPLDSTRAVFSWTPAPDQAGSTNQVVIQVSDNGTPIQSATNSFQVIVNPIAGIVPTSTVIGSSSASTVYGTPVTFSATVNPAPTNGETVAFVASGVVLGTGVLQDGVASFTTAATALSAAGSPYAMTAVYGGDGYYQNSTSSPIPQTMARATISVSSGLGAVSKNYDGTATAAFTSNSVSLLGVAAGDAGSVVLSTNGSTALFASRNAGSGIAVTISGLTLSGSAAPNYILPPPVLSANILPLPVTLATGSGSLKISNTFTSGNNQFEVYNGLNGFSPALNGALYTNFQCDVRFAPGSATQTNNDGVLIFGHLQFGTRNNYNQDYFGGANYGIDIPATNTGWVHIDIPISVAADSNLASINDLLIHIYGPSYTPTLIGPSTLWVDNLAFVGPTNRYVIDQFNPAGSGGNSYSGGQIGNVWGNWFGASWTGNSWDATNDAVGIAANNKTYDGTTAATVRLYETLVNTALSGVLSGDAAGVLLATNGYTAVFAGAGPGSNITVTVNGLTLAGSAGGNYAIAPLILAADISQGSRQPVFLSIAPAASSITYGQSLASSILSGGAITNLAGTDVAGSFAFTAPATPPGAGTISAPVAFTPADLVNYMAMTTSVPVSVTAAAITVTADNASRTAGLPNPAFTAAYDGFVAGEDTNVLTAPALLTTTADAGSSAGDYPITPAGAAAANYTFNYVPGTLTVVAQPQLGMSVVAGGSGLTFPTLPGQMYQLVLKTNLSDTVWTPVGDPIPGTGGLVSITNNTDAAQGFYLLQIWQP
ncbi:MAG: YDG domain-containing protein [Verrucomicrobiota bacterium]